MKKIFFVFAVVASSFGMSNAQNAKTAAPAASSASETAVEKSPEVRAKELVAKINNSCQLQGDQWGKVNTLFIEFFTKADGLKSKKTSMDAAAFKTKMTELKSDRDKSLTAILTPEQNRKVEAAKAAEDAAKKN